MFNSNINNRKKIVCDTIKTKFLDVDNITLEPGSLNPTAFGSSADSIIKLNNATSSATTNDIVDLRSDQTITGLKTINNNLIVQDASAVDNNSLLLLLPNNGNSGGFTIRDAGTNEVGLKKRDLENKLVSFQFGQENIELDKDINLLRSDAIVKFEAANTLSKNYLQLADVTNNITLSGATANNINLNNGVKLINFDSAFSIKHDSGDAGRLEIISGVQKPIRCSSTGDVAINNGGLSNPSVCLNINSGGNKALLGPSLTTTQRNTLTPVDGMLIYNTTTKHYNSYNGTSWKQMGYLTDDVFSNIQVNDILATSDSLEISNAANNDVFATINSSSINIPSGHSYRVNNVELKDITETLTNKTISGASNTISNIPDNALSSNITTLTGTQTLTNKTINANNNTISNIPDNALSSNIATLNGTQTLLNKTIGSSCTITTERPITSTTNTINYSQLLLQNTQFNDFGVTLRDVSSGTNNECGIFKPGNTDNSVGLGFFTYSSVNAFLGTTGFNLTSGKRFFIDSVDIKDVAETLTNKTLSTGCAINTDQSISTSGATNFGSCTIDSLSLDNNRISTNLNDLELNPANNVNITNGNLEVAGTQVVSSRITGYVPLTGTRDTNSVYVTSSITLQELAERVKAIQDDLTAHGLIGV